MVQRRGVAPNRSIDILAQRFAAKRSHPVLFLAPAAERARAADHTAYDRAVADYAGLGLDQLAPVALRVLTDVT